MKKISPLVGKQAIIFGDGGWEFSGEILADKKDRVVLSLTNGDTILIFRRCISAILLPTSGVVVVRPPDNGAEKDNSQFVVFKHATKAATRPAQVQQNDDLSEGGVSLPHEVLLGTPIGEAQDNEFSSFFGAATGYDGKSRLSVTLQEEDDS